MSLTSNFEPFVLLILNFSVSLGVSVPNDEGVTSVAHEAEPRSVRYSELSVGSYMGVSIYRK